MILDSMGGTELVEERWLQSEIQVRGKKILIFGRKKFLILLEDTDDWLGDGTFKCKWFLFRSFLDSDVYRGASHNEKMKIFS
jgi:hypothetical protein